MTNKTTIYPPRKKGITDEGMSHWVDPCSQRKQGSERSDKVPAFTLYTLHLTPYTKQGSERSDEVPAFNLSPLTSNLNSGFAAKVIFDILI